MGAGGDVEFVGVGGFYAGFDVEIGGTGDHGGVVGGEIGGGEEDFLGGFCELLGDFLAEKGVGGDATGNDDRGGLVFFHSGLEFFHKDVDGGVLEGGGEVGGLLGF